MACVHAAALHPTYCSLVRLLVVYRLLNAMYALAYLKYSWHKLLNIGSKAECCIINQRTWHAFRVVLPPGSLWFTLPPEKWRRQCRGRKQKWGCWAGVQARLSRHPHKPCQQDRRPGIHYINTENYPRLLCYNNHRYCMWLNPSIQVDDAELAGRIAHRFERTSDSGKNRGGEQLMHKYCDSGHLLFASCLHIPWR